MKILNVTFENLNSLKGKWEIDFTHPSYTADGIFAITGPTGAGKSTILDAVCLALYGRTPRLGKVTTGENEIMSRRTGYCSSEVTFETHEGQFRCHWSQKRAGSKHDGKLQNPKHEISRANGEILAVRITEVAEIVQQKTGMDFDQFTRSVLLAQGGFAVFLQASPADRAPVLEQITGTGIYSQISIEVHNRNKKETGKLKELESEIKGIQMLSPEEEESLKSSVQILKLKETQILANKADSEKALQWVQGIRSLEAEIAELQAKKSAVEQEIIESKQDREILEAANRASSLHGIYAALQAQRKSCRSDEADLDRLRKELPALEKSLEESKKTAEEARKRSAEARAVSEKMIPLLNTVRLKDQEIRNLSLQAEELNVSVSKDRNQIRDLENEKSGIKDKQESDLIIYNDILLYLQENDDEWLASGLPAAETEYAHLKTAEKDLLLKKEENNKSRVMADEAGSKLNEKNEVLNSARNAHYESEKRCNDGENELRQLLNGRHLPEYRKDKEHLLREAALLQKIADLEDLRGHLEDGRPCPLCGSSEHPYAKGKVPVISETEIRIQELDRFIGEAESLELKVKQLNQEMQEASRKLALAESEAALASEKKESCDKDCARILNESEILKTNAENIKRSIEERLKKAGIEAGGNLSDLMVSLKDRLIIRQEKLNLKAETEKRLAAYESELSRTESLLKNQIQILKEKEYKLKILIENLEAEEKERFLIFGDRDPGSEERKLRTAETEAEKELRSAEEKFNSVVNSVHTEKAKTESIEKRLEKNLPELQKTESLFSEALEKASFKGEEEFIKADISPELRQSISLKINELDKKNAEIQARISYRVNTLRTEKSQSLTDESEEALRERVSLLNAQHRETVSAAAEAEARLSENRKSVLRLSGLMKDTDAQRKECERWRNLDELIGSADGKKYRNFVQGLTFEMMIHYTNQQLQKMSDRYLLIPGKSEPLELDVIDNYQAGEIRSTKNLSGGESFIISLALALGLSRMASRSVRVDSLFLDEGFGTLDEEALDSALETLTGLQQEGRMIGIISHVTTLKERISLQIQVTPANGGISRLSGPGVRGRG